MPTKTRAVRKDFGSYVGRTKKGSPEEKDTSHPQSVNSYTHSLKIIRPKLEALSGGSKGPNDLNQLESEGRHVAVLVRSKSRIAPGSRHDSLGHIGKKNREEGEEED